jgi:predicted TIM-barrel fold metal-dependent hydrolase
MANPTDSEIRLVDAHHHLWDLERHFYPWLSPRPLPPAMAGDVTPIARSYSVDAFLTDAKGQDLVKSVHVEAGFDYAKPLAETQWLQEVADAKGFPHAIIAKAELQRPDVDSLLAKHKEHANVRGIRHMVSWHKDPMKTFIDRPDLLTDEQWLKGFALLKKYDLSFDLQVYPSQMDDAVKLARRHPDISIVLNHTGMPADRDEASLAQWRRGMKELGALPNATVKISGLGMFDHHWTVESIRPYVLTALDAFGTGKSMFASNFPVDKLYSSYSDVFDAFKAITRDFSLAERRALFAENAERIYRI